jgi:hypothetical protein
MSMGASRPRSEVRRVDGFAIAHLTAQITMPGAAGAVRLAVKHHSREQRMETYGVRTALAAIGRRIMQGLAAQTADSTAHDNARSRSGRPDGLPPPRREATKQVAAEDKPLAAYLTARALDRRPVEGQDLERLQRADQTVQASRRTLLHGRGNVSTDIAATEHESSCRVMAAHAFAAGQALGSADKAAVAAAAGAGVCDDFARVAMVNHAQTLQPEETLMVMKSPASRHSWVEVAHGCARPEEGGMPTRHPGRITVDGWAEGPAVFSEDRNQELYAQPVVLRERLHEEDALTAVQAFEQTTQTLQTLQTGDALTAYADTRMNTGSRWAQGDMFDPTPAISPELAQRVQARMSAAGETPLRETLAAVSAARAMGANVAGAVGGARDVLDAVQNLPRTDDAHRPTRG